MNYGCFVSPSRPSVIVINVINGAFASSMVRLSLFVLFMKPIPEAIAARSLILPSAGFLWPCMAGETHAESLSSQRGAARIASSSPRYGRVSITRSACRDPHCGIYHAFFVNLSTPTTFWYQITEMECRPVARHSRCLQTAQQAIHGAITQSFGQMLTLNISLLRHVGQGAGHPEYLVPGA